MYGSEKNVDRSHSKQLEAQSLKFFSFIYYSLYNTANGENDGCECDAGYNKEACIQVHFCVLIVSFSEDKHTYIKCVDWCCDGEGAGNNQDKCVKADFSHGQLDSLIDSYCLFSYQLIIHK